MRKNRDTPLDTPRDPRPVNAVTGVTIRRGVLEDVPTLGRLAASLVKLHHDLDGKRFVAPTPYTAQGYGDYLGSQLEVPTVVILVAERNGGIIGYTYAGVEGRDYMSLRGPAGVVYDIVVDPAERGKGVGRILLDATLDALRLGGARQVVLSTAEHNLAAQRLFARAGFRRTMIEMTRELS